MKNKILVLLVVVLAILPFKISASEVKYNTLNLEQALTEEQIEHDLSNYSETKDQAIIYLFRGRGCGFCQRFLTFLNSIVDEYGQYFRVVSYEVWKDSDNAALMNEVASFLGTEAKGVPFIVIGDQYFPGYASTYDESIKAAIKEQYDSKNSYDVMTEMKKAKNKSNSEENTGSLSNSVAVIIYNFVFITIATVIILVFSNSKNKKTLEKIEELKVELSKVKQTSTTSKTSKTSKKTKALEK